MANDVVNVADKSKELVQKGESEGLWPQKLSSQDKQQLAYIAAQYGLDPFFGDLTVLGSNAYVTSSGLKRNAHESDDPPVSIQLEAVNMDYNKRHFEYKALLWKESSPDNRPYIEYGEASPQDCNRMISGSDKDLKAMARTRATNRVIRLAYNISITSAEEISGYDPDTQEIQDIPEEDVIIDNSRGTSKPKGTNSKVNSENPEKTVLWFGKFEGKKLEEVNTGYLKWLVDNAKQDDLKQAAKLTMDRYQMTKKKEKAKKDKPKNKEKRETTEREAEIKELIGDDQKKKNMLFNLLSSFNAKSINSLDEEEYLILRNSLRDKDAGPTEEDLKAYDDMSMEEVYEDFEKTLEEEDNE